MSLKEARKYISELHKKQENPYLWPDFITGLPNTSAIISKTNEIYSKLGKYTISYIRISNIHPYLAKYGTRKHSEIIQWTAAILKTTMNNRRGFVGALGLHDFVAICSVGEMKKYLEEISIIFDKKIRTFYSKDDLRKKSILSFTKNGNKLDLGLMKLIAVTENGTSKIAKENLIPYLAKLCSKLEKN